MKKIGNNIKITVLILLACLPAIFSLIRSGYFPMHDDIQAFRLLEMDKCIKDLQIPCRWIPDMGFGYGYPQFNYYGPTPYYLMEVVHLAGIGFLDSTKIGFALSVIVSALGMFLLAKSIWGNFGGVLASIFYIYAPYRAVNIYVRGAMGEAWGMAILPFIFWSTKGVIEGKKYSKLWLALSIASLFTSHNITALIFIPFYIVWILYLIFENKIKDTHLFGKIKNLMLSVMWGLLMSAFFTLPAYFEQKYVHIATLLMGYFNYLAHYVGLRQMLFSTHFGYGSSELGPNDDIFLSPGILHWLFPLILIGLGFVFKQSKKIKILIIFVLLGWISLFMMHPRSVFIWKMIPLFSFVQFPWRFLTIATLFFSLSMGFVGMLLAKNKLKIFVFALLSLSVIFVNINYFKPDFTLDIKDSDKFSNESWQKQLTISIFDYLPIYAKFPPVEKAPEIPLIIEGIAEVVSGNKGTDWQNWEIKAELDSILRFPVYYFPNWMAYINGEKSEISYDNELGLITLNLKPGNNWVNLKLENTPLRVISNFISVISILLIPFYLYRIQKHEKKAK